MYQFIVRDVKGNGKIFTDTMPGFSKLDINSFLVNQGYEVYSIKTSSLINFVYKDSSILGRQMSMKDLVFKKLVKNLKKPELNIIKWNYSYK